MGSDSQIIYMDHAATTFCDQEVVDRMVPFFAEKYGNPASIYSCGREAARAVAEARGVIADSIGASPSEIIFTSGGSEGDNMALRSVAGMTSCECHIITGAIEHHAVLNTCKALERHGVNVTYLPVDEYGLVDPADVERSIRDDTRLISVMMANNEIGTIEPIARIGEIARSHGILFHTDAVQAYGHIPIDVRSMNIDIMSVSAHKLGGPKGVGFNYIRNGLRPEPLIYGGPQERNLRAGTTNVPGVVGFGAAVAAAMTSIEGHSAYVSSLRDRLEQGLVSAIPGLRVNGHPTLRLPGHLNVSIPGIEGETLLILLDRAGICASSGSACSTGATEPSHVLTALGLNPSEVKGSVRFTLSHTNTQAEVDHVVNVMSGIVPTIRIDNERR